ncbi:MAG TPA: hypothetical protein PLI59_06950 [Candidatus Obscuribacter sp.]|nr:hypothetical protein [Candidatus Obscuribacter sp.]
MSSSFVAKRPLRQFKKEQAPALVFALVVVVFQSAFALNLSPTTAYQLSAAAAVLNGAVPFVSFYFDELPTQIVVRLPEVLLSWLGQYFPGSNGGAQLAIAHYLLTQVYQFFVFAFCLRIWRRSPGQSGGRPLLYLLALMGAQLPFVFQLGCVQHLVFLGLVPLLFWGAVSESEERESLSSERRQDFLLALLTASAAASLSLPCLPLPFLVVTAQALLLARPSLLAWGGIAFALLLLLLFGGFQLMPAACASELGQWILTLRASVYKVENMMVFGIGTSPDRRDFVYCLTASLLLAFGIGRERFWMIPLAVMSVWGFLVYTISYSGLSDFLVLGYMSALVLLLCGCFVLVEMLTRVFPRLFFAVKRERRRLIPWVVVASLLVGAVAMPVWGSLMLTRQIKDEGAGFDAERGYIDLRRAIEENSAPGERVILLNGRLAPACPELLLSGRQNSSYFLNGEPLGLISNLVRQKVDGLWLARHSQFVKETDELLAARLKLDLDREPPVCLLVEGGEMEDYLTDHGLRKWLVDRYELKGFARYISPSLAPREFCDWNWDYGVYRLKSGKGSP